MTIHRETTTLLNDHVLDEIFSIAYETSPSTIVSVVLANRHFHRIAHSLLYRHVTFNMASPNVTEEVQTWFVDEDKMAIPRMIRRIHVGSFRRPRPAMSVNIPTRIIGQSTNDNRERNMAAEWETLAQLVSHTTQLRSFTFSCPQAIPLGLLQAIDNYPTTLRLNISNWTRSALSALHDDPVEVALAASPALRSIHATIHNPRCNLKDFRIPAFWRIALSAPNLQTVILRLTRGGCVVLCNSTQEMQHWKALASDFCVPSTSSGLQNLKVIGDNLALLKGKDLSRLQSLDYSGPLTVQLAASLISLTHLTLRTKSHHLALDDILTSCTPLQSLTIVGWSQAIRLDTILVHHGQSLRALALHELERNDLANVRPVLSIEELRRIGEECVHLNDISIDLNLPEVSVTEQSKPLAANTHSDVYETFSKFSYLQRAQLNFNLGISSYRPKTSESRSVPQVDDSFVRQVWDAINHKHVPSARLKELRVALGEAGREVGFGYPASWVSWERRNHHWFKVTPAERDYEHGKVQITKHRDTPDFCDDTWKEFEFL